MKRQASPRRLGTAATLVVFGLAAAAFFVGFYVLPSNQSSQGTVWQRICRAAGFVASESKSRLESATGGHTQVVLSRAAIEAGTARQIGRGATLALRCAACHGARGISGADAPNLAGQYSEVIYKQLVDFQHGDRASAIMGAMVAGLTDRDMLDLAHYYAFLPQPESNHALADAPALVRVGDPMRNVAPCASCHGIHDRKVGAPNLDGEPESYLETQLTAFAGGSRSNDINAQMRNEARLLTAAEILSLTRHYAAKPMSTTD
jgi:cytochrome c553